VSRSKVQVRALILEAIPLAAVRMYEGFDQAVSEASDMFTGMAVEGLRDIDITAFGSVTVLAWLRGYAEGCNAKVRRAAGEDS
jgi:hypothetical protein